MSIKYWDGLAWKMLSPYNINSGSNSFSGTTTPVEVLHGLPNTPFAAQVFPLEDPEGFLGEVWIDMDATKLYIGNTGEYDGDFQWMAISFSAGV